MVGQHAADGLGEAAAHALVRDLERLPRLRVALTDLGQGLLGEVQRETGGVGLEVRPRTVALERVTPLWNLPLEGDFGFGRGTRQIDQDTVAGGLDVRRVHQACQRGDPEPGDRAAAGVEREVVGAVEPPR